MKKKFIINQKNKKNSLNYKLNEISKINDINLSQYQKEQWKEKIEILNGAGYGTNIVDAFLKNSILIFKTFGFKYIPELADMISFLVIKSNKQSGFLISDVSEILINYIKEEKDYEEFLGLIKILSHEAPETIEYFLKNLNFLFKRMNVNQIVDWSMTGLKIATFDKKRRIDFFNLKTKEPKIWLYRIKKENIFENFQKKIKYFNQALWNLNPSLKELENNFDSKYQRPSFNENIIYFPTYFEEKNTENKIDFFYAISAHIVSHLKFSDLKFSINKIKPVQIAVISIIEDARVEALSMKKYPGLKDIWLPFHKFDEKELSGINLILASLSRALIDKNYVSQNNWVNKGKKLFYEAENQWNNQQISIEIGNKLSNDIGQMRMQFDFKNYLVLPSYRDDNLGLWDFNYEDNEENVSENIDNICTIKEDKIFDEKSKKLETEIEQENKNEKYKNFDFNEINKILVSEETEYDYILKNYRTKWTKIYELSCETKAIHNFEKLYKENHNTIMKISSLIKKSKNNKHKQKRNYEGEFLNLDACIENTISLKSGSEVDGKIFDKIGKNPVDSSLMILLDISKSTNRRINHKNKKIIDLEIESCAIIAESLQRNNQKFAISAFCSNTREEIRYFKIKTFTEKYSNLTKLRLSNLKSEYSTRLGAAIRYSYRELENIISERKLLLVLSDGEPSDIDVKDKNYLVEDAKRAVFLSKKKGIDIFCFGIEDKKSPYLEKIFGKKNSIRINNLKNLHNKIAKIYLKLTI